MYACLHVVDGGGAADLGYLPPSASILCTEAGPLTELFHMLLLETACAGASLSLDGLSSPWTFYLGAGDLNSGPQFPQQILYSPSHLPGPRVKLSSYSF